LRGVRISGRELLVALAIVLALLALFAVQKRATKQAIRANPTLTPGALNPDVTQANIRSTICVTGWTATIRPPPEYTDALKLKQMREYGETGQPSAYEEDHLISLELGGAPRDPRNLWPEPRPRADEVDRIENELNAKACSGALSLADAQRRESDLKHRDG
jgi:hypothetical protein